MVLGKKVAIFYWEWGQNSAPRDGQKIPWNFLLFAILQKPDGLKITCHVKCWS